MNKGFTLIELLVVVLIIGILSAVALPQYEKAVRKSRVVEARTVLRSLGNAQDLYILAQGEPSWGSWDELDITVPAETKHWTFEQEECIGNGCGVVAVAKMDSGYQIEYWSPKYDGGPKENSLAGKFFCNSWTTEGEKACKGLGKYAADSDRYELQ